MKTIEINGKKIRTNIGANYSTLTKEGKERLLQLAEKAYNKAC